MVVSQQKLREILFELLYSHDIAQNQFEDMIPFMMKQHEVTKKTLYTLGAKKEALVAVLDQIDQKITDTSVEYAFDRISKVEKNILRLAIFELCFQEDIPDKVAISEAVRLSRKFSTPEGASFVNAILDAIYKEKLSRPA